MICRYRLPVPPPLTTPPEPTPCVSLTRSAAETERIANSERPDRPQQVLLARGIGRFRERTAETTEARPDECKVAKAVVRFTAVRNSDLLLVTTESARADGRERTSFPAIGSADGRATCLWIVLDGRGWRHKSPLVPKPRPPFRVGQAVRRPSGTPDRRVRETPKWLQRNSRFAVPLRSASGLPGTLPPMSDLVVALAGGAVGSAITVVVGQAGHARVAWTDVSLHDDEAAEWNAQLLAWVDDRTLKLVVELKGSPVHLGVSRGSRFRGSAC
jgi:hypothetical protein